VETIFIKFTFDNKSHNSEGIGDGIGSIFTICDALYDSESNSTIVIDEPELSLHPAYQKD
jgi:predicted ATPase